MMIFKNTLYRLTKSTIFWILTLGISLLFVLGLMLVNNGGEGQTKICTIAIFDEDDTVGSRALVESLKINYNIRVTRENEMQKVLLEQFADVGLKINHGFGNSLKDGIIPQIEIVSFSISTFLEMVKTSVDTSIDSLRVLAINADDETLESRIEQFNANNRFEYEKISKKDYSMVLVLFGIVSFFYLYIGSIVTKPFIEDKVNGMKFRFKTMPISPLNYNIQSILAYLVPLICLSFVASLATLIIVKISFVSFLALLLSTCMFSMVCISMAIMIYAFLDNFSAAMGIYSILTTILGMLGGAFWPISFLPGFLRSIANFNPVYWFMKSIEVISGDFASYTLSITMMLVALVVFLLIPELKRVTVLKRSKLLGSEKENI